MSGVALAPRSRHRRHANPFTVRGPVQGPDWEAVFGRRAPLAVDVGCGAGRFACELAAAEPGLDVIGLEIRPHLVAAVQAAAAARRLRNVHALVANANAHWTALLPPRRVACVTINFPDPWYKKRHHKRRVVSAAWLTALAPSLVPGAALHAMTDYAPIAEQMRQALSAQPGFACVHPAAPFAPHSTTGLTSEREIKHLQRGEPIYRLHFVYRDAAHGPVG